MSHILSTVGVGFSCMAVLFLFYGIHLVDIGLITKLDAFATPLIFASISAVAHVVAFSLKTGR
jgi:hypothetical protein